jgi:hypothetical protein
LRHGSARISLEKKNSHFARLKEMHLHTRRGGGGDHFHQLSRHASRQATEVEVKRNDENAKILLDKENETNVEEMKKR